MTNTPSPSNQASQDAEVVKATPPPKEQPVRSSRSGVYWLALLVLIAVGLNAAAGFWGYQYLLESRQQLQANNQQQQQQIDQTLNQALAQLASGAQMQQQVIEQTLGEVQQQNTDITNSLAQIAKRRPNQWHVAEAHYLIQLAARSLWFDKTPQISIAMLQDAENRLKTLTDPKLLGLRQAIRDDITQLSLLQSDERQQTQMSLHALMKQVLNLPLPTLVINQRSAESDPLAQQTLPNWQRFKNSLQHFVQGFVRIQRRDSDFAPLITTQQQWLTQQSLRFHLQRAYAATERGDTEAFTQWINEAIEELERYFDISEPAVRLFIHQINQLQDATLAVEVPSALNSLTLIETLKHDAIESTTVEQQ